MESITHTLTRDESVLLVNALGQLPTNSGIYPVLVKLVEQHKAQFPQEAQNG